MSTISQIYTSYGEALTFSRNKYTDLYHARIPTLSAPADLSPGLVVTAHTVAPPSRARRTCSSLWTRLDGAATFRDLWAFSVNVRALHATPTATEREHASKERAFE